MLNYQIGIPPELRRRGQLGGGYGSDESPEYHPKTLAEAMIREAERGTIQPPKSKGKARIPPQDI